MKINQFQLEYIIGRIHTVGHINNLISGPPDNLFVMGSYYNHHLFYFISVRTLPSRSLFLTLAMHSCMYVCISVPDTLWRTGFQEHAHTEVHLSN